MKNVIITALFSVFALFSMESKAQNMCQPGSCPPCMQIDEALNSTSCLFEFVWSYDGYPCSGMVGAFNLLPFNGSGVVKNKIGPCVQFCDDPCECPTALLLKDPNGPGTLDIGVTAGGNPPVGSIPTGPNGEWEKYYCNVTTCDGGLTARIHVEYQNGTYKISFDVQGPSCP